MGGEKKWKNDSTRSSLDMVRICPAPLPPFLRCFFVTFLKVSDLFGFQFMTVPVTFFRIGSSSVRRLGTSYRLVRMGLVKYGFGEKWNTSSKPVPSGKSLQAMSVRYSRQSMSSVFGVCCDCFG